MLHLRRTEAATKITRTFHRILRNESKVSAISQPLVVDVPDAQHDETATNLFASSEEKPSSIFLADDYGQGSDSFEAYPPDSDVPMIAADSNASLPEDEELEEENVYDDEDYEVE